MVNLVGELLALLTFANIFLSVRLHARPPISLRDSAVGQRSAPYVIAAYAFVNFVQESFRAVWVYTLEIRTGDRLLV